MRRRILALVIVIASVVFVPAASAAPGFVQSSSGSISGTSLEVAYGSNVASHSLLVGQFRTTGTTSVSDSVNGTWAQAVSTVSEGVTHSVWYRQNAAAGATKVTVSGGSSGSIRAVLGEYSGVATSGALDQTACNQGNTTSVSTGSTASVAAGDLLYAGVGLFEHPRTITAGSSNGVSATLRTQFSGEFGSSGEEDVTSAAAGAQNASFTLNEGSTGGWAACAATFHMAAPEDVTLPVVSGTPRVGFTLTTTNGTWASGPTSYSYQWERCKPGCTEIAGATSSSYAPQWPDTGTKLKVAVTATNGGGSTTARSAETETIKERDEVAGPACNKYASTAASGTETGTKAHPYKTVKKLFEHLAAGEVGCLQEGQTFKEPLADYNQSGSAGKPLTISSTNVNNPATINEGFTIVGSYVTFTHVKVQWEEPKPWACWNASGNTEPGKIIKFVEGHPSGCETGTPTSEHSIVVMMEGEHDTLTYSDISSVGSTICVLPLYNPKGTARANETVIEHNRIHDCGPPVWPAAISGFPSVNEEKGWHMHGVYDEGKATTVKNNYIYGSSRNGILDWTPETSCTCTHNVLDHNGNGISINGFEEELLGPVGEVATWNVISNSTSLREQLDWGVAAQFYPAGSKEVNSLEDNIIYNNLEEEIRKEAGVLKEAGNKEKTNPEYACGSCKGELPNYEIKPSYAIEGFGPESPPTKY